MLIVNLHYWYWISNRMLGRSFARRVDRAYAKHITPPQQHIFIDNENHSFYLYDEDGKAIQYKPTVTGSEFHACDDLVRGIIGPYGSGKTTAMLSEIVFRSCAMPIVGNKRYSRWAIIRNTYAELESTTYVSWCSWFGNLGSVHRNKKPLLTMRHHFNDDKGEVELEVIFIALDSESDVRKLKSLEVCGIYINEASEIPYAVFEHTTGRVGRYMMNQLGHYWKGVLIDTNPPNSKHWIPRIFEADKVESHTLFHQPPGLIEVGENEWAANPAADNFERLGEYYYRNLALGKTREFINVYCLGKYGSVISGKAVYHEYNDDLHSADTIAFDKELPVYIGMDFGLTPCAIFMQVTPFGTINIIHELVSERLGITQFIDTMLSPFISQNLYDAEIGAIIGDPAGEKKNENDLTSCFDILHAAHYRIQGCTTNLITPRLEAVRNCLNTLVDGKPKFQISRKNCPVAREGFLGGYEYKKLKVLGAEVYDSKPNKNFYSHIQDAIQYLIVYLNNQNNRASVMENYEPQMMRF